MDADLLAALARIEEKLDRLLTGPARSAASTRAPVSSVAPASDLDGQHGDPELRKSPPRWQGRNLAGLRYSQCTVEELECVASFKDWCAQRDADAGDEKKANYSRLDAARARGWAERKAAKSVSLPGAVDDDGIPF